MRNKTLKQRIIERAEYFEGQFGKSITAEILRDALADICGERMKQDERIRNALDKLLHSDFLIGEVMRMTKGTVNPKRIREIIDERVIK